MTDRIKVTVTEVQPIQVVVRNTVNIPGAGTAWGGITGTLSDQTDLQTALDARDNRALASQAEAEVGTENTKGMTPLRTAEAIAALGGGGGGGSEWGEAIATQTVSGSDVSEILFSTGIDFTASDYRLKFKLITAVNVLNYYWFAHEANAAAVVQGNYWHNSGVLTTSFGDSQLRENLWFYNPLIGSVQDEIRGESVFSRTAAGFVRNDTNDVSCISSANNPQNTFVINTSSHNPLLTTAPTHIGLYNTNATAAFKIGSVIKLYRRDKL